MKLYRAKIPDIAHDCIEVLVRDGDIEVAADNRAEAEADLAAIMNDFIRRDSEFRERIKDRMSVEEIPYQRYGKLRTQMAENGGHPIGDDVERFLVRQFVENLMISRFIEEVYGDDQAMYKKLMDVVRSHDVDEEELRLDAMSRIKNVREGTVEWEVALQGAMREVKKRRGLL